MLVERISDDERDMIDAMRHNLNECSGNFFQGGFISTISWLTYWENAKNCFLAKPFKNTDLILRKKISAYINEDDLKEQMRHLFWTSEYYTFRDCVYNAIHQANKNFDLHVWGDQHISSLRGILNMLFNIDAFISNRYMGDTIEFKMPNGKMFKLMHGCKTMKAIQRISYFCNLTHLFEPVRLEQSQILNEAKFDAMLCLSIHPLDYMTASVNKNDWTSCMNWYGGEYRRGVIEMMNSPYVLVAYIESNHEHLYLDGHNTWNSKRWREFFIVAPEFISGIKGYPYWNRYLENETLNWIKELYAPYYREEKIEISNKMTIFDPDWNSQVSDETINVPTTHLNIECGPAMYNDFGNGSEFHMFLTTGMNNLDSEYFWIDYSGFSECVVCGNDDRFEEYDSEGELVCSACLDRHSCCTCGELIETRDDLVVFEGREYCRYCYDNLPCCTICGQTVDEDNSYHRSIRFGTFIDKSENDLPDTKNTVCEDYFDEIDQVFRRRAQTIFCCNACAEKVFVKGSKEIGLYHPWISSNYRYLKMVQWRNLTDFGHELFCSEGLDEAMKNVETEGYIPKQFDNDLDYIPALDF